jgi:AcrR family transcriptional regulator
MTTTSSKSAANRKTGKYQTETQRVSILDAAEQLFLQNGLEKTTMSELANQAEITRVTLYRYFANRDAIALEIQVRMMNKIASLVTPGEDEFSLESKKQQARSMIRNFDSLRDAYRYIGMFDKIYLDNSPDSALTQWTKNQLISWNWGRASPDEVARKVPHGNELSVIMNTIIWFLEKLAMRGELTWSDQAVPLEEDLKIFEEMIMRYFDRLLATQESGGRADHEHPRENL